MKTNQGPSAFRIWLHPRRSRREMESLLERNAALESQLAESGADCRRRLAEKDSMIARLADDNSRDSRTASRRISELEKENADLRAELSEWRQTRMEIDAINARLAEWEKVKEQYEKRIRKLKEQLGEISKMNLRNPGETAADSDILEEGETFYMLPEDPENNVEPTGYRGAGRTGNKRRPDPTVRNPRHVRLPKDDTDWLMTLPPE